MLYPLSEVFDIGLHVAVAAAICIDELKVVYRLWVSYECRTWELENSTQQPNISLN